MAEDKKNVDKVIGVGAPKTGVVQVASLNIREDHAASAKSVGGLVKGNEVTILDTWTDGKDTWARIGPNQWAAVIFNGETYIKIP
ncbi:MAG TPA: SH3 domain-containing protein [Anaerolineaceae bacterium]|nr:SH3 domain-containing protein [Anaerolineaceae bacterium]HPN50334.1 SH3 domain-containing protein [Anaerolineaceae bacterium]